MKILGRLLEHLGSQMYKRRDTALAELVANAWDAGATEVTLVVPTSNYDPTVSQIVVSDNGVGMTEDQVELEYLVVGRNRRITDGALSHSRKVMGRKGIGKLAGFGIAGIIEVSTTSQRTTTEFALRIEDLKRTANEVTDVPINGRIVDASTAERGTVVRLSGLKHTTPPKIPELMESLGRRFSLVVHGEMRITVNDSVITEPDIDFESRFPSEGWAEDTVDGQEIRYYYGFSKNVLSSRELRGFTLYAHGKTAQAPPFFFNVESTASGQHATRYLYGAIEIDYLDDGTDDEGDLISTDRQEIDWEAPEVVPLQEWGANLTRRALREWADRKEENTKKSVLEDPQLSQRIERLDKPSQKELMKIIGTLGRAGVDPERLLDLASSVVAAYEYRHFYDFTSQMEALEDPDELSKLLEYLTEWKILESRAILEVVRGRLQIIDKFHSMLVNNAPETAPKKGMDNLHDLIADYPWLLNPEWQVLYEEKRITTQLREWGNVDIADPEDRQRYDFLALEGTASLLVIEIKRSDHAVDLEDLQRLQTYAEKLQAGTDSRVSMVLVSGPKWATNRERWASMPDLELLEWGEIQEFTKSFYSQYRAVLEADVEHRDFDEMKREIARTRSVISDGAYRGEQMRMEGLGPQYPTRDHGPEEGSTR
jgi:hypothetical protein